MSNAELTARTFYDVHHIASMPEDVKRCLMILMLQSESDKKEQQPPLYSENELADRISKATKEAVSGDSMPIDMFFEEAENKYPWLCN